MLNSCTEQEFRKYVDRVYEIALDQSRSGYPTYSDGIKTKEMFIERAGKAFQRDTEEILLFEYESKVEGWIHYYRLPEDNYLQTVSFNIAVHTEQALEEFLTYVGERFKGDDVFLGFSTKNIKAINYLAAHGFERIEESWNNTLYFDRYRKVPEGCGIVRIDKENYAAFRELHSEVEGDMYWNSDRIYEDIEHWMIFVKIEDGQTLGCVYYMLDDDGWFEIYGLDMKGGRFDPKLFRELMGKALNAAEEINGKYMTMFCEAEEQPYIGEFGFECVGGYVCYKKEL